MKINANPFKLAITAIVLAVMAYGCSSQNMAQTQKDSKPEPTANTAQNTNPAAPSTTDTIEAGDLVTAHYTMMLENGDLFYTTDETLAASSKIPKVEWFKAPTAFGPEEVLAGNDKTRRELAQGVVGMLAHGQKRITLPAEKGFGPHDAKKVVPFPRTKTIPKLAQVTPKDFVVKFNAFPVVGEKVNHVPYFESRIKAVKRNYVVLEALAEDGQQFESEYGVTTIKVSHDEVAMQLNPTLDAPFELKGQKGRITQKDGTTFSVDFNHPAAGQPILLEIQVVAVSKADQFKSNQLSWIEDHDSGFEKAAQQDKPMVMVLYADWCSWSKKLMNQTVSDPRIQKYWDDFVWVKVDSDKQKEYKDIYGQDGYPMVVMTDSKGEVINKVDGFRDPRAFREELRKCLAPDERQDKQA